MEATITILTTKAEDPDQFEDMSLEGRRERSVGWKRFPLRSGRYMTTFLMKATDSDFGMFGSAELPVDGDGVIVRTHVLMRSEVPAAVLRLTAMVEEQPDETAEALVKHGGNTASLGRVREGLRSGTWPESGDPAEETAAFAFHLLALARVAAETRKGVCFEYRGQVRA
jgi:hypothetical protein